MVKKYIIAAALAATWSVAGIAAQQPQTQKPAAQAVPGKKTPATIVGCVYREKDIPGRAPNVAERAGILEDYILAEISSSPLAGKTGTAGATGTSGQANVPTFGAMYKLEFASAEKLQTLVGRRVEAVGQIDAEEGDAPAPAPTTTTTTTDKIIGRDRVNLSEFEVASIKEVPGTCPASPAAAR